MQRNKYFVELVLLFVMMPLAITTLPPDLFLFVLALVVGGIGYIVWLLTKRMDIKRGELFSLNNMDASLWRAIALRFVLFALISTCLMWLFKPEWFFSPPLNEWKTWLFFCVFYAAISVFPQEVFYRLYFFKRYQHLFSSQRWLILLNAGLFCFAHLMFMNSLIFALTFIGSLLFATTYQQSRSVMPATLEHAMYGIWLFTLGLGPIFGFPL